MGGPQLVEGGISVCEQPRGFVAVASGPPHAGQGPAAHGGLVAIARLVEPVHAVPQVALGIVEGALRGVGLAQQAFELS